MSADDMLSGDWRGPETRWDVNSRDLDATVKVSERKALVERVNRAEKKVRVLEDLFRQRVRDEEAFLAGRPDVAALVAEVAELRGIVQRQNDVIERLNRKQAS